MNVQPIKFDFLREPWSHQREAFHRAVTRNSFAFFFEPGTGKTFTTINVLRYVYAKHGKLLPTLILCPPIVVRNWRQEILMSSRIKPEDVVELSGHGHQRKFIVEGLTKNSIPKILITNYESLTMPKLWPTIKAWEPSVVVYDESHKCKNIVAVRTKRAIELAETASYRYLLTGTPILNSAMDIFAQYRIMDLGETFGKNFYFFRAKYFVDKNAHMKQAIHFPDWQPRAGTFEEINAAIKPSSMTVKKSECLDLPPLVKKTVTVDLSTEQRRLYTSMKKDFIAYVRDQACVASLAITKALRLQQIVSGFIPVEGAEGEIINAKIADNPRAECLKELLADITPLSKVLVWACFRENYRTVRQVCEDLRIGYVEAHGEISQKEKEYAIERLNSDDSIRVYLGHPQSSGIGVNLVSASYSIFYSRSFSLENDIQAEARNYRGGSEIHEKITRIDIVATDTIDEIVQEKLANKVQIGDKILQDFAKEIRCAVKPKPKSILPRSESSASGIV